MRLVNFALLLLLSPALVAQEIGDTVVAVCETVTQVQSGGKDLPPVWRGSHLRVKGAADNLILVEWQNQKVWISNRDVASLDEARRIFTEAIAANPTANEYSYRGMVFFEQGQFLKAISDFDQSLQLNPSSSEVWYDRARTWEQLHNIENAHTDYDEAIRLDPKNGTAHYCRGCIWLEKKDPDRALADFEAAIRLDPFDFRSYLMSGRLRSEKKQFDEALDDLNKAIQLNRDSTTAYAYRAYLWQTQGKMRKAISDYNEVILLDPQNSHAHHSLAWIYCLSGNRDILDPDKAIKHAKKACELTAWKESGPLATLAAAHAAAGHFEQAVEFQQKAFALYSEQEKQAWGFLTDLYKSGKTYDPSEEVSEPSPE